MMLPVEVLETVRGTLAINLKHRCQICGGISHGYVWNCVAGIVAMLFVCNDKACVMAGIHRMVPKKRGRR